MPEPPHPKFHRLDRRRLQVEAVQHRQTAFQRLCLPGNGLEFLLAFLIRGRRGQGRGTDVESFAVTRQGQGSGQYRHPLVDDAVEHRLQLPEGNDGQSESAHRQHHDKQLRPDQTAANAPPCCAGAYHPAATSLHHCAHWRHRP